MKAIINTIGSALKTGHHGEGSDLFKMGDDYLLNAKVEVLLKHFDEVNIIAEKEDLGFITGHSKSEGRLIKSSETLHVLDAINENVLMFNLGIVTRYEVDYQYLINLAKADHPSIIVTDIIYDSMPYRNNIIVDKDNNYISVSDKFENSEAVKVYCEAKDYKTINNQEILAFIFNPSLYITVSTSIIDIQEEEKFKIISYGRSKPNIIYNLNDTSLESTAKIKRDKAFSREVSEKYFI